MKEVEYVPPQSPSEEKTPKRHWGEHAAPLRTYAEDVAEALREGAITKTKIIMAEQKRRSLPEGDGDPTHRHLLLAILIAAILLTALAAVIAVVFFGVGRDKPITDPTKPAAENPSPTNETSALSKNLLILDISEGIRSQVIADLRMLSQQHASDKPAVITIQNGNNPASATEVFSLLSQGQPEAVGQIKSDRMLILRTQNHPSEFSLILFGNRNELLVKMFKNELIVARALHQILDPFDETTPPDLYSGLTFRDTTMSGVDVRVLRREDGSPRMVWGIVNNALVISPSEKAFSTSVSVIREGALNQ